MDRPPSGRGELGFQCGMRMYKRKGVVQELKAPTGSPAPGVVQVRTSMRPLRVQLIAVLTALAVLLPGSALARTQYFCRMMNRVVGTCCCNSGVDTKIREDASCVPQVRASDCCQKITTADRVATVRALATDFSVPPALLTATVPAPAYVFPRMVATLAPPAQARAPPGVGPPLFILNCSFLT